MRQVALEELAALSPDEVRRQVAAALECLVPQANPDDRSAALSYLTAIPHTLDQVLLGVAPTGDWALATAAWLTPYRVAMPESVSPDRTV